MKKLLTTLTAMSLTATSATSLTACSTKLITNNYTIKLASHDELNKQIRYIWDTTTNSYINNSDGWDNEKLTEQQIKDKQLSEVKSSLNGSLGQGNAIVQDLLNVIFYNAKNTIINNNKSLTNQQYVFSSNYEKNKIYVDGQSRTAGFNSNNEEDIKQYYANYKESKSGIASILGLVEYSKYVSSDSNEKSSNIPIVTSEDIQLIDKMYNASKNQGIRSIEFENEQQFVNGNIGLADSEVKSDEAEITKELKTSKITEYETSWINKTKSNYSEEAKYSENYKQYIAGGPVTSLDPFAQTLISTTQEEIKNTNITLQQIEDNADWSKTTPEAGILLNTLPNPVFEYKLVSIKDANDKVTKTFSSKTYGYQLVKLDPIKLKIIYNDDINIKKDKDGKEQYLGKDYEINLTVDGLYASYAPILSTITNDTTDGLKDKEKLYLGWRLAGYQFNKSSMLGYGTDGKALNASDRKNVSKNVPLWENKYNEMAITDFAIQEKKVTN
ncbi:hypothetical protein [Mesoplasma corruscae]|uniref:Lipoprotein n=1 Tax=Mesoplasma corruscae TaxID=216874 RepID=A0A2S5RGY4_9MOLU|nr:hypothetical protein [Mesoplasma corruscae]PPE06594.1 hypothetical protein MCORR_v1c02250 [Mesoplasma corruscae]